MTVLSQSELEASQQYVEAMERLFNNPDFKVLLDDLEGMKAAMDGSWRSLTPENLKFEQGRYEGLSQTTGHLEFVRKLVAQVVEHDATEASALELYSDV